jgi:hypothetical protein
MAGTARLAVSSISAIALVNDRSAGMSSAMVADSR